MTENEAISEFDKMIYKKMMTKHGISEKQHELYQTAIDALEEIQEYKTLGTVRELNRMKRMRTKRKARLVNPFNTSLDYYCCPNCNSVLEANHEYCSYCGQAIELVEVEVK